MTTSVGILAVDRAKQLFLSEFTPEERAKIVGSARTVVINAIAVGIISERCPEVLSIGATTAPKAAP